MASISKKVLLNQNVTADTLSSVVTLNARNKHFIGFLKISDFVSGQFDVTIEHSPNGTDWFTLMTFTAAITSNKIDKVYPTDYSFFGCFGHVRANVNTTGATNGDVLVELHYDEK